ncbi:hypothetical protein L3V83_05775 [Thiotrichales bacterium 19X7-9]|nr:hypothetical protein [Thiotrichales bacterium 19X7-9]TNF65908.1 MAG: hypothetical protein EP298_10195 [Gammaproteobacteria bacterium]UTW42146.1 hypothetical protein KFE69_11715 [bacterium SCSIO 12844]
MSRVKKATLAGRKRISELSHDSACTEMPIETVNQDDVYLQKQATLLQLKRQDEIGTTASAVLHQSIQEFAEYLQDRYDAWSKPKNRHAYILSPQQRLDQIKEEIVKYINDFAEQLLEEGYHEADIRQICQGYLDEIIIQLHHFQIPIRSLYLVKRR